MRAVVTGGSGFIGSHLVERLAARGDEVTICDPAPPPPDLGCSVGDGSGAVRHVAVDIRDRAALSAVITRGVDVVFHLTAMVGVDRYLGDPLEVIDVTVGGTHNVLALSRAAGAKVIVASTSEVFGRNPETPWSEESDRVLGSTSADRWSYSSSKAVAEHLTFAHIHRRGLAASIIRYFNVYGPRQRPAYVLSKSIHRVLRGHPPYLYDGGAQTRCFTFVDDAVEATLRIASSAAAEGESFNVGSERETSMKEAVWLVTRLSGASVEPLAVETSSAFGAAYQDIPRRVPDTTKARTVLGWQARTPLEDGLAATIEWARRNPWWLRPVEEEP